METDNLIEALRQLPGVRLQLIDLAWEVARDDGSIDAEQLLFRGKELEEATCEARAYAEATRKAVSCLMSLGQS